MEIPFLQEIVSRALQEDLGSGDLTTGAVIPSGLRAYGWITAEEPLVLAGMAVAEKVFRVLDPRVEWRFLARDGEFVRKGTVLATLTGEASVLLSGERVALNFVQRLSGIATLARRFAERVRGTGLQVVDTRKTTPGLRSLEKYAVRVGGCGNHRFGLFDGVLIKENHIAMAGGITSAVWQARQQVPHTMKIEVETGSLAEVREAVAAGADIIMLDNMDPSSVRKAVRWIRKEAGRPLLIEVSGRVSLPRIRDLAAAGADLVSVGALIHSARWVDISMDISKEMNGQETGGRKRPGGVRGRKDAVSSVE